MVGLDAVSARDGVDGSTSEAGAADLLGLGDREALLVVVDCLDGAADGAAFEGSSDYVLALYAEDVHAVAEPVDGDVSEDDDEADHGDKVRDPCGGSIGDCALNRWEDCRDLAEGFKIGVWG